MVKKKRERVRAQGEGNEKGGEKKEMQEEKRNVEA